VRGVAQDPRREVCAGSVEEPCSRPLYFFLTFSNILRLWRVEELRGERASELYRLRGRSARLP
jgi:hypothetical protein